MILVMAKRRGQRAWLPFAVLPFALLPFALTACGGSAPATKVTARNLVLITVDTLRADHVGAYGYTRARTPALDGIAARGAIFERAYSAAPITLTSHATILTGRYPPGHGARDNGLRMAAGVPTLATLLHARGLRTAAFVAAFPLDHQFGLGAGFDVYADRMPRAPNGQLANERPASDVIADAIAWLRTASQRDTVAASQGGSTPPAPPAPPPPTALPAPPAFFLWVHLFEPHAPYGDPASGRSTIERYDDEIATADREIARLLQALEPIRNDTLIVAAGDHGEAFGEHGEYAHSIFVYDTTLRVPLVMSGPGIAVGARVATPVTLADVAPTMLALLGEGRPKGRPLQTDGMDGVDLSPVLTGGTLARRELYAESFAPLVEFGWAPLRAVRSENWKAIAAPTPELFDVERDPGEQTNLAGAQAPVMQRLAARADRYSPAALGAAAAAANAEAAERLRALGYAAGSANNAQLATNSNRADPKDRRELAARIAQVTSGELSGAALVAALEGIVKDDPRNGQAHLRLGYARLQANDCVRAEREFRAAADSGLPSADIYLGLATCLGRRNDLAGAERALDDARRLEPDNPALVANLGILRAAKGDHAGAIQALMAALAADPNLLEARFNLALEYARSGRRADAEATAHDLLARLPAASPQRSEVERLLRALR